MTTLHVSELVLIQNKKLVAVFTFEDGYIGNHIFEEALRVAGTQMGHVYDQDLLESHVLYNVFIHRHRLVMLWRVLLVNKLQHPLGKKVVLKTVVSIEIHRLLCSFIVFIPLIISHSFAIIKLLTVVSRRHIQGRVLLEQLYNFVHRNICVRHEFHQRQSVKAAEVSNDGCATVDTEITALVN